MPLEVRRNTLQQMQSGILVQRHAGNAIVCQLRVNRRRRGSLCGNRCCYLGASGSILSVLCLQRRSSNDGSHRGRRKGSRDDHVGRADEEHQRWKRAQRAGSSSYILLFLGTKLPCSIGRSRTWADQDSSASLPSLVGFDRSSACLHMQVKLPRSTRRRDESPLVV